MKLLSWFESLHKESQARKLPAFTRFFKVALNLVIGLLKVRNVSFANQFILPTGKEIAYPARGSLPQAGRIGHDVILEFCTNSLLYFGLS